MQEQKIRLDFLDTLKGVAILGVVIIHINAQILNDITLSSIEYGPFVYETLVLLSYFSRLCVPLFIMITGYLYWNSKMDNSLKATIKRLTPVILVYLIWSMIYSLPTFIQQGGKINIYELFFLGKSAPQMYYIPLVYIPVVILVTTLKRLHHSPLNLVINIIFWVFFQISGILKGTFAENLGFIFVYALIGAFFSNCDILYKSRKFLVALPFVILFVIFLANFMSITGFTNFVALQSHYDYFKIPMLAYTLVIFSLFYFTKKSFSALSYLGKRSTSIYFQHWLLYIFAYSVWQQCAVNSRIFFYPLFLLIVLACTYLPAWVETIISRKSLG